MGIKMGKTRLLPEKYNNFNADCRTPHPPFQSLSGHCVLRLRSPQASGAAGTSIPSCGPHRHPQLSSLHQQLMEEMMRKPRDFDAELKSLEDKARELKARKVQQLGELVISTGADAGGHGRTRP